MWILVALVCLQPSRVSGSMMKKIFDKVIEVTPRKTNQPKYTKK